MDQTEVREQLTLSQIIDDSHTIAKEHGWWDQPEDNLLAVKIALMHAELSEALEDCREGLPLDRVLYRYPGGGWSESPTRIFEDREIQGKPFGPAIELADAVIRISDTAGKYQIPLEEAIRVKTEYNRSRPYRHGGKSI